MDHEDSKGIVENNLSRVMIIGRNYGNILTMARALGMAGYEVEVLKVFRKKPRKLNLLSQMKPDAYSKYVKQYHEFIANEDPQKVVEYLIKISDEKKRRLLMPVDDYTAYVVDEYLDDLKPFYVVPNVANEAGAITHLMDKNKQKKLAKAFDLPMLQSILVSTKNGNVEIPDEIVYPCFVKPNVSMKSTKALMRKCDSKEDLQKVLELYAQKEDVEVLVEQYAEIRAEYSILGLSTKEKTVAPGLFQVIEGGHKERKGVTIIGRTISCDAMGEIIHKCNKFIASLQYTGLFDVDLIETADGKLYFVELNFRAGASIHAFTQSGVNLPGMLADYLMKGQSIDESCQVHETGKYFVSEKVMMEEYTRSDIDMQGVKRNMEIADIWFVKDKQDPEPYQYFKKFYMVATLMRIPYRIREYIKNTNYKGRGNESESR